MKSLNTTGLYVVFFAVFIGTVTACFFAFLWLGNGFQTSNAEMLSKGIVATVASAAGSYYCLKIRNQIDSPKR